MTVMHPVPADDGGWHIASETDTRYQEGGTTTTAGIQLGDLPRLQVSDR
jgi:hypothetical protein